MDFRRRLKYFHSSTAQFIYSNVYSHSLVKSDIWQRAIWRNLIADDDSKTFFHLFAFILLDFRWVSEIERRALLSGTFPLRLDQHKFVIVPIDFLADDFCHRFRCIDVSFGGKYIELKFTRETIKDENIKIDKKCQDEEILQKPPRSSLHRLILEEKINQKLHLEGSRIFHCITSFREVESNKLSKIKSGLSAQEENVNEKERTRSKVNVDKCFKALQLNFDRRVVMP